MSIVLISDHVSALRQQNSRQEWWLIPCRNICNYCAVRPAEKLREMSFGHNEGIELVV